MNTDDTALVQKAQHGDKFAFAELVNRYESRIYNLARRMVRDSQDAEDVLQETFLSVYRHLGDFHGDASFSTWLYRIATNASLMKLRARKPPAVSLDEPVDSDDDLPLPREVVAWEMTPEEALLHSETRAVMDRAIGVLPETLRAVFVLRDVEGLSVQETAEVLGISVPNVKTRLHRARLALRDHLSAYFAAPAMRKETNDES